MCLPAFAQTADAAVDKWLWQHGIHIEAARRSLRGLLALAVLSLVLGLALLPLTPQPLCFCLGVAFSAINQFFLTRSVNRLVSTGAGAATGPRMRAVLFSMVRLLVLAAVLLVLAYFVPYSYLGFVGGIIAGIAVLAVSGLMRRK